MSTELSLNEVIESANKKMDGVVAKWFQHDPILLGVWCLVDKKTDVTQKTIGINSRGIITTVTYNPYFVNALSSEYLEAVMVSEGFKLLLKHPTTRHQTPKVISNIASQLTINDVLAPKFLDGTTFSNGMESSDFGLESGNWFEYYFKELNDAIDKSLSKISIKFNKSISQDGGENQTSQQSQSVDGDGQEQSNGFTQFDNKQDAMKEYFDPSSTSNKDWAVNDLLDSQVKQMVDDKKDSSKNWGKYTGDTIASIVAAHTPKVSYKDIIRRFNNSVISSKQLSSRMKLNRRYGLDQPGYRRVYKSKIIIAVDTSGSITNNELSNAFAIINSLCKHSAIEYIQFDTEITLKEKKFKKAKQSFDVVGRGGTDFQCVIDYAEKSSVDGLIIITDGIAKAPTEPKSTKVLWVLTDDKYNPPVDWGMKCYFKNGGIE